LPIPARQELALAAYLAALSYIQEKLHPGKTAKTLDRERFWCLYHLFSERHWQEALRKNDPEMLKDEAVRIFMAVHTSMGQKPRSVVNVSGLKELVAEWGLAWLVCVSQAPRKWAVQ
jgi:hypothetical protein